MVDKDETDNEDDVTIRVLSDETRVIVEASKPITTLRLTRDSALEFARRMTLLAHRLPES